MTSAYLEKTKNLPPSPLLLEAIKLASHNGNALDIGSGGGKDTKFLLEQGFKVTAVDKDPDTTGIMRSLPHQENLEFHNQDVTRFKFGHYDLVNAQFSLPFLSRESLGQLLMKIKNSLNPGGVFVGQLFGPADSWSSNHPEMSFFTQDESKEFFSELDLVTFREEEFDGQTTLGQPKHWQIFHIIARRTS